MKTNKDTREIINRELQEIGSSLHNVDKHADYEVPSDYFERLPGIIQEKIIAADKKVEYSFSTIIYKRLVPLMVTAVLLAGLVFSLFFIDGNSKYDKLGLDTGIQEYEYLAYRPNFDHDMVYEMIMESDLSADDILFGSSSLLFDDADDDILEEIFENARYFGMESRLLLSYLD